MLKRLTFVLTILATPASAGSYLVFDTQADALARSAQECEVHGCDGVHTKYWWPVVGPLNAGPGIAAGSYAVEITVGDPSYGIGGLTADEQAALVPEATITPLLPQEGQ